MSNDLGFGSSVNPEWVNIQKRTFTGWANGFLKIRQKKILDMELDFEDGILLIHLLELISNKELPKYNKVAKIKAQKLENVQTALTFVKNEGIKLVNIGAEDFVDHKLPLILGFIWTLILRYHIQKGGLSASAKSDLLKWVQSKIPHKNVVNFTDSWRDGTSLCELVEALKPGQIDCKHLNPAEALKNATNGADCAEKNMDIPKVLDPADMVAQEQDELSIMTYISYFRDYDKRENWARQEEEKRITAVPEQSTAHGPGLEGGEIFKDGKFTIEARNCFGDLVKHGGDEFVVIIKGPKNHNPECKQEDHGDGTYSCVYVPEHPGTYVIAITLKNKAIKGSPWRPNITKSEPDTKQTIVEGPGIENGNEAGKQTHFKIIAKDKAGNQVPLGGDPFKVKVSGPFGEVPHTLKDNGNGTYDCVYTPTSDGHHVVEVLLKTDHVAKSPYHIEVDKPLGEPDASKCEAYGPGLENGLKTAYATHFNIKARNKNGDVLKIDPTKHSFSVEVQGPDDSIVQHKLSGDSDGTLKVEYTPIRPGDYKIDVVVHDARETIYYDHIKGSTFKVSIKASAHAAQSEAFGPGLEDGVKDTQDTHFTVLAKDIDGNKILHGGDDIKVEITGPKGEQILPTVTDNGDGTYKVEYRPVGPGKHTIKPTVRGDPVKKAPFYVNAKAGTGAGFSVVEGYTFRIRAMDLRGEPKKEGGDDFKVEITGPKGNVPVKVEDQKDGSYLVSYKLPESNGEYKISVTLGGEHIKGSPWKQFS